MSLITGMGVEVIDFTELKKRGLLKIAGDFGNQTHDVIDFTGNTASSGQQPPVQLSEASSPDMNAFDFLTDVARTSVPSHREELHFNNEPNSILKLNTILNKIEDVMYKIETLSNRIAQLEARLKNGEV